MRSQWDTSNKATSSKKCSAEDIVILQAKLKKKDKIIKSFLSSTTFGPSGRHKSNRHAHSDSSTRPTGSSNYRPSAQVGRGKEFATKADFFAWKHTLPQDGNIYCIKNGLKWTWWTKCKSWGSHEVTTCRHTSSNKPTKRILLPQALIAVIPLVLTLLPLLQAVMMMRTRRMATQTLSAKLATYLGAFNNYNSHDYTVSFDSDSHQIIIDT
eukprot:7049792-Ditylum_brightwellii.AAC.1